MLVNRNELKGGMFEYLSKDQLNMIHMASLEILENTGVLVYDDEALTLLKEGGAFVDFEKKLAKIPANMVEDAIRSAPSKITLCGVDGQAEMHLYKNNVYFGLGTDLPKFADPYTGEIRETVLSDVANVAKIAEQAEGIDFIASLGLASDIPQQIVDLYHLLESRKYCNKPNWTTATNYGNMKAIIDMAAISAGGYDELRRRPTIGVYNEPVSPLTFSMEAIQKLMLCAEYCIPTTWASGIIAGATGPMSLAGTLALGNAEGLGGLVIHQLKRKGAPFIYGNVASVLDMKTAVNCYGGPELPMMHAVVGQLGRLYDIPTYGTGGCTDANSVDAQAGLEAMCSNMLAAFGGTNLTHDNGYIGAGLIGSLEMILLDSEIASYIKRITDGIEVSEETLCLDLIHKVGPGGAYITQKHTMQNFKKESFIPAFLNRKRSQAWLDSGGKTLEQVLNEKVREILESDSPILLTPEVTRQYEDVIERRKKEIQENKLHRQDF